jgi:type I restriction enzyme, S subunit
MTAINLPKNWCSNTLRDLATINYGKSPKAILSDDGDIPVVGTGGVERYGSNFLCDNESIILGRKGTIDKVGFVDGKFWVIDTAYYLSGFPQGTIVKWLFYFLQTIDFRIMNEATGVPSLSRELLYKIQVPTPTTEEQLQIATILSTLDQVIEQTDSIIAKQRRIKAGLMHDLLLKGVDEYGAIRSEATHEFKDSPLGRIPVEWELDRLGKVANLVTSGSRGWARFYSNEGAVFLRIGNLTREHINFRFDDVVHVNVPESSEGKRTAVQEGDLLISITADLGIIGVVPKGFTEAYVNQHIALVRLKKEAVLPRFIGHLLNGYIGQMQIDKLNESGAKAGLNLPTIENLLVIKPTPSEQEKIVAILDSIDIQIAGGKMRMDKLRHQKAGLMHDLLSGKVRVNDKIKQLTAN